MRRKSGNRTDAAAAAPEGHGLLARVMLVSLLIACIGVAVHHYAGHRDHYEETLRPIQNYVKYQSNVLSNYLSTFWNELSTVGVSAAAGRDKPSETGRNKKPPKKISNTVKQSEQTTKKSEQTVKEAQETPKQAKKQARITVKQVEDRLKQTETTVKQPENPPAKGRLFTKEELSMYDGEQKPEIYISIVGRVYDVTKGKRFYGVGEHYSIFSARDATRSFMTGDFVNDLNDNIDDFDEFQCEDLQGWVKQYDDNAEYPFVGLLCGTFYDCSDGKVAASLRLRAFRETAKGAAAKKALEEDDRRQFPPCNSEYANGKGGKVWCSNRSGGINRDWVGVPRKYFSPTSRGGGSRCACVEKSKLDSPLLKEYDNCAPDSESCPIK